MPCPPDLVNYLVVQVSDTEDFAHPLTQILPASAAMFPVNGAYDTPKWVRAKWRRSTDPLDEGPWSNVLPITFLKLTPDEVDGTPGTGTVEAPAVPVIRSVYGWSEFIELVMLSRPQIEGAIVGYGVAQLTQNGESCIYIKNLSSDPSVSVVEAALIIGEPFPQIDCHGDKTIAAGFHPNDPFETGDPIVDVSNYAPYIADPPEAEFAVSSGQIQYYHVSEPPPDGVTPGHPDYECLTRRCPDPSDPGYNAAYACTNVFDVAKTPAGFSLPGGGDYYVKVDSGIARAYNTYVNALGRTVFPPLLQVAIGGVGIFAGFTQVGSVYVKFSTGVEFYQQAKDLSQDLGGYEWLPQSDADIQLEDFFVFISESPFSNDLDSENGLWQSAMLNNELPDGVHLVMVSRSTNLLVSNIGGQRLDPPKTPDEWPDYNTNYYFRVGARRPANFGQTEFLYSATLSEQASGRLGSMERLASALGLQEPQSSTTWKEPVATADDLPTTAASGDVRLVRDENLLYAYVDGLWSRTGLPTLRVVGEILFGVGTVAIGSSRAFRPTVPKGIENGVLTGWCLQCDTAGNGDTVVDIHKNGTTIFTNQANRPKLVNAQTKSTGTTIDVTAISSEDDLTLDIDSVPGTVPTKLTAILYFRQDVAAI